MSETPPSKPRSILAILAAILLVVTGGYVGVEALDSGTETIPTCGQLPPEAQDTTEDILRGGPYAYPDNDSQRFGNYEGHLPEKELGFYREYTVETPGVNHRGARRIVTGGGTKTNPEVWYYTDDHYESFCEIPNYASR